MDFILGVIATTIVLCFLFGASKNNREHEIYEEGYLAGKGSNKYDRNN